MTAEMPSTQPMAVEAPPPLSVASPHAEQKLASAVVSPARHRRTAIRISLPAVSFQNSRRASRAGKAAPRAVSTDRDAPKAALASSQPMPAAPEVDPLDSDDSVDTSNMKQMASMPPPAPPVEEKDDLDALRHRLIDRPAQPAPELGQVKPSSSRTTRSDGWIRF
jgi:hypothetical protein